MTGRDQQHLAALGVVGLSASPLPPEALIEAYCQTPPGEHFAARYGTKTIENDVERSTGFCGFLGYLDVEGARVAYGFDDGYSFIGALEEGGWKALASKGDWPYLVYMLWRPTADSDRFAIAEYCEGDLTVWVFGHMAGDRGLQEFYRSLKECQ